MSHKIVGRERIAAILKRYFSRRREVAAALLYGSRALGSPKSSSDADVAVLLKSRHGSGAFSDKVRYATELESLLGMRADVAILNEADPFLRIQALSTGKEVFVRDRRALESFKARSQRDYWDFIPILRAVDGSALRRMSRR